jgi:hypothetical protein
VSYSASPVPFNLPRAVQAFLREELRRIEVSFGALDNLTLPALPEEPARLRNGMVVYANGTTWNPGSGAGFYGREGGAWVKL